MDSDSQNNYQEDVSGLEHIEHNHPVELKPLTHEMELLRKTVKDKDNDPMDAIALGTKTQRVSYHTRPPTEPIGEVLNKYTNP